MRSTFLLILVVACESTAHVSVIGHPGVGECGPPKREGGTPDSQREDDMAEGRAIRVCRDHYNGCLVRLIRVGDNRYQAICRRDS